MKVLIHCCCGPCSIYPFEHLKTKHIQYTPYFYNPNIHPFKEFRLRLDTFIHYCKAYNDRPIIDERYGLREYLDIVFPKISDRCTSCYEMRLEKSVKLAKEENFDAFTTTLLYSKYQNHQKIIDICNLLSEQNQITFYYADFRQGWDFGVQQSKDLVMYRQPYCGCIFSEQERYDKSLRKKTR